MPNTGPHMQRLNVDITNELYRCIREACEWTAMGPQVEQWLWNLPEIQAAAKRLKVERKRRRYVGMAKRRKTA